MIKRTDMTQLQSTLVRITAIVLALVAAGLFILVLGKNPLDVYAAMIKGAFGTAYRCKETVIKTIPLVITSLGIMVAFKMKFWNIGAEGQIFMGAFAASYVALNYSHLPQPVLLVLMMVAGMLGGGVWALLPAVLKTKLGANETLLTLMLNYIALKWVTYLQYELWKNPKALGFPEIEKFADNAVLPKVWGVHIGWMIALVLVVCIHIFLRHTKKGYEISVIGESENTARYAGMNVGKVIVGAALLSGALCGLTGMIQASAVNRTLAVEVTNGVGFTAIITTWLAQLSAPVVVLVSLLFAAMLQGGDYIQTAFQIPQSAALILQSMILFFVLGSEFFVQYKIVLPFQWIRNTKKEVAG